jgi:hypothetical protein
VFWVKARYDAKLPLGSRAWKAFPAQLHLERAMEQVSAPLHLGIGPVPDLPPHCARRVGIGQPLGHDAPEVQPLDRPEKIARAPADAEDRGENGAGLLDQLV